MSDRQKLNQGWSYREKVKPGDRGQTLLDYYTVKYRHSSRTEWQTRIESGQILLNNSPAESETILQGGETLCYHRLPWIEPPVPLQFEILYEDPDLLVIDKPAGLPVIPGGGFLEHTLLWQLKAHYPQNPPTPIHRLGRGTSGLLLLGRSSLAKSHLAQQLRYSSLSSEKTQLQKVYRALAQGNQIPDHLTIDQPIGKIPHPLLGYIYGATQSGKYALSRSQVIQRYEQYTLLEVTIFTGRPHQIRIHLAAVGYPLLGDPLYIAGGTFAPIPPELINQPQQNLIPVPGDCGYFLHAHRLSFIHPRSLKLMTFTSPVPENWQI